MGVKRVNKPILKFQMPQGIAGRGGGGDGGGRRRDFKASNGLIHSICKSGEGGGGERGGEFKIPWLSERGLPITAFLND